MKSLPFILVRVAIYLIPAVIIAWAAWQYFGFSGTQEFSYDFSQESPFISILWPPERTSDIYKEGRDSRQDVLGDPTSFALQMTRPTFPRASVTMRYQKPDEVPLRLGLQKGDGSWNFFFEEVTSVPDGDWQVGQASFRISPDFISPENKLNFIISSPYLGDSGERITITDISVRLERDPITFRQLLNKLGLFL